MKQILFLIVSCIDFKFAFLYTFSSGHYKELSMSQYMKSAYQATQCKYWITPIGDGSKNKNRGSLQCGKNCNSACCLQYIWDSTNGCLLCTTDIKEPIVSKSVEWIGNITANLDWVVNVKKPQPTDSGTAFRTIFENSYAIYNLSQVLPSSFHSSNRYNLKTYTLQMQFQTTSANGILFYADNCPAPAGSNLLLDVVGAYIKNGYVHHLIDNHKGPGIAKTTLRYDDGLWHTAKFVKNLDSSQVCVDGVCKSAEAGATPAGAASVVEAFKVGGVPSNLVTKAENELGMSTGFKGCIKNLTSSGSPFGSPTLEYQTMECCKLFNG